MNAQMSISRVMMEERAQRDMAVQHALAQGRHDNHDKITPVSVVAVQDKVHYNSWTNAVMEGEAEEDKD
jgi:hypothetical protein